MVEIANRFGQLGHRAHRKDGHRAARANLDGPVADVDQKPTTQAQAQLTGLIDTKAWGKPGKLDAPAKGGWNDWEPLMLSYIGQLDRNLMHAMKNPAASETPVMNVGWRVGPEHDSSSTLRLLLTMTWRLGDGLSWSLMQKLLAFEFTNDTTSFEVFDKECPRVKQVTSTFRTR